MSQLLTKSAIRGLYPLLNRADWRIVAMLTEEAGEVQGAFNKSQDLPGSHKQTKGIEDVIEELIQLYACVKLAGWHFALDPDEMDDMANEFMRKKALQIKALAIEECSIQIKAGRNDS